MVGNTSDNKKTERYWFKEQLVKAARMYAMRQKAGVAEPMDVTGLAVVEFEDMPLRQAMFSVRSNERNVRDFAWAFSTSKSSEEFEQRPKEFKTFPNAASRVREGIG